MYYNVTDHKLMKKWCTLKAVFFLNCLEKMHGNDWAQQKLRELHSEVTCKPLYLQWNTCTTMIISRVQLVYKIWTKGSVEITSMFNREKSLKLSENYWNKPTQRDYLASYNWTPLLWNAANCKSRPGSGCFQKLLIELLSQSLLVYNFSD